MMPYEEDEFPSDFNYAAEYKITRAGVRAMKKQLMGLPAPGTVSAVAYNWVGFPMGIVRLTDQLVCDYLHPKRQIHVSHVFWAGLFEHRELVAFDSKEEL